MFIVWAVLNAGMMIMMLTADAVVHTNAHVFRHRAAAGPRFHHYHPRHHRAAAAANTEVSCTAVSMCKILVHQFVRAVGTAVHEISIKSPMC